MSAVSDDACEHRGSNAVALRSNKDRGDVGGYAGSSKPCQELRGSNYAFAFQHVIQCLAFAHNVCLIAIY